VSLIQFTDEEVEKVTLNLDEQKGPGPDGISPSTVKKSASVVNLFVQFVSIFWNCCLASGRGRLLFLFLRVAKKVKFQFSP
jgi:hypothetical protein